MDTHLSPKQIARAIGVSESTLKRWSDQGLLPTVRTAGGHRKLPLAGVLTFIRERGYEVVRPEVLGLPVGAGRANKTFDAAADQVREALENGEEVELRRVITGLYLAGHNMADICDGALARAFVELGDRWEHGDVEIYQERRGVQMAARMLAELRRMLPDPRKNAPLALGATLTPDIYTLPVSMAELALRELGWRAQSLGSGHPAETLVRALRDQQPALFWLSVSHIGSTDEFLEAYATLGTAAEELNIPLVVGGRMLDAGLRERMKYTAFCDNLSHLVSLVKALGEASSIATSSGG